MIKKISVLMIVCTAFNAHSMRVECEPEVTNFMTRDARVPSREHCSREIQGDCICLLAMCGAAGAVMGADYAGTDTPTRIISAVAGYTVAIGAIMYHERLSRNKQE